MIQITEHNHSEHVLTFEDLWLMESYRLAEEFYHEHKDYYLAKRGYGLPIEDVNWWIYTNISIRWTDIHADSINIGFGVIFELCEFSNPVLASKIITQHMTSLWSLKRVAIFLLHHGYELNEFVVEATAKKYPWNYIKGIVDEYAEIHSDYWFGNSITTLSEISYYRPYTVISDSNELDALCQQVIAANAKSVEDYRKGKVASLNHLKGQVMKMSKGKADVNLATEILKRMLS